LRHLFLLGDFYLKIKQNRDMLEELFQEQRALVNAFFDCVDLKVAQKVLDACLACKGKIVFSGVGKSGIVAEKLATTLTSTGTSSVHLTPTNALHGDIATIRAEDLLILLSKSGESDELLDLIPLAKQRVVKTMTWVSNDASRLARLCDFSMTLPLKKELCPFDLAPTTSSALQLIFGDILIVALMKSKKFSLDEYALNHPAGAIGKKATMRVADLMLREGALPLCGPDDLLKNVLVTLSEKRCGCILITKGDQMLGIFTDGDLRRALQNPSFTLEVKIKDLMHAVFESISPDAMAFEALKKMEGKKRVMMLPVIENNRLVGLIHIHDILQAGLKS